MGLGRFALKRIQKKTKKARISESQSKKRKARGSKILFLTPPSRSKKVVNELVVAPPQTKVIYEKRPDPIQSGISTEDFIRPYPKLKQAIEGFLLDQNSFHTQKAYAKDLKRLVKYLLVRTQKTGSEPLNRYVIVGFKDWLLSEGLEHTTIDRHLATLRGLFHWLVEEEIIEKNPAERVRFLNPKKLSKTEAFTDEEVRKVLDQPNLHHRTGAQHYAILMILFHCGLRRSELCSLRTSSLSIEQGHRILRLKGKGNQERIVPVVKAVWSALIHYLVITRKDPAVDQYLFSPIKNNRSGNLNKALDPSMIFYIVKKYSKEAGIQKRVSPHSCRATAISHARDKNISDRAIQEFAGWSSPDMITRYDKRKTAIQKSAAHVIDYYQDKAFIRSFEDQDQQ